MCSMSSDDSQNNFARDYDDQYDDEVISESRGSSPGHSDDVEVVNARPVGGRPTKARPTASIQSTSLKAPPKKMGKVHQREGSSSRPKGKPTSKPKTTGGNDVELDTNDTPTEITVREDEQVGKLLGTEVNYTVDRSLASIIYCRSRRWISVHFDSLKAVDWEAPMEVAETDPPKDVHAADSKRAWLTGEKPRLADTLAHGAFSLPEMFNMLFQISPPPADFVNEKTDYVAGQAAELFVQATVDVSHRDQEIRELKEKVKHLEAHIDSLNRYPGSDQFFRDAAALYPSRPTNLPALVKSFCSSEDVVAPLLQALHQDPVDGIEDWEQVRALLPEQIPLPGPEPFSDPPIGPSDSHTADSRSHVP
nr:uncharacterized protein LOC109149872 [Ipomoea batatas]